MTDQPIEPQPEEAAGGIMADAIAAILDDLGLSVQQREAAAVAVPRHLRPLAGDLDQEEAV